MGWVVHEKITFLHFRINLFGDLAVKVAKSQKKVSALKTEGP